MTDNPGQALAERKSLKKVAHKDPMNTRPRDSAPGQPALVAFVSPLCMVVPDSENAYSTPIEEINNGTYDHSKLCRIVAAIRVPQLTQTSALVCGDGAIAIPASESACIANQALDVFNGIMCSLVAGGHPCEALDNRDIVGGNLLRSDSIWPTNLGHSLNSYLHSTMRMKAATPLETIRLNCPTSVTASQFLKAYNTGRAILDSTPFISPTLLLRGRTEMLNGNLTDALSNLWIVAEQLTEGLWASRFIGNEGSHPTESIPGRRRSLMRDSRTWSTSVRQEMMFQMGLIPSLTYAKLYPARKARNTLVHAGQRPNLETVRGLLSGVIDLIEIISDQPTDALRGLARIDNHMHLKSARAGQAPVAELSSEWQEAERRFLNTDFDQDT